MTTRGDAGLAMCRDPWCQGRALQLLSDLLEAFDAGALPARAFCINLAEAFQAPAALYVRVDVESQRLSSLGWPGAEEAPSLTMAVEHLWRVCPWLFTRIVRENTPSCVSLDPDSWRWRGSIADLLLWELGRYGDLAQVPLNVAGPEVRLLALVRRRCFTVRDMHLLRAVHRPLAALDHVLVAAGPDRLDVRATASGGTDERADGVDGVDGHQLTPREVEVLGLLAEGLLARSIAARMRVSTRTVHKHLGNVYRKLEAHDRLLAVARAQSLGLIPTQRDPRGPR